MGLISMVDSSVGVAVSGPSEQAALRLAAEPQALGNALSGPAVAGVRPCEEKGPFPHVAGKRGRSLEF